MISGQQTPCTKPPPVQAPLSQSPPGRIDQQPFFTNLQTTTQTQSTLPPSTSISVPARNQTDVDINYILSILDQQSQQGESENGVEGRNMSEEDFTELDLGLVTFREPDDDHTNADQNIPGSPDFNPFTGEGLTPTFPTTPTDLTTISTDFPTISTDFSTISTDFSTIPTDFPITVNFPQTTNFPTLTSECDQLITSVTTDIQSPNYPNNYPVSVQCSYVVGRASANVCRVGMGIYELVSECIYEQVSCKLIGWTNTFLNI